MSDGEGRGPRQQGLSKAGHTPEVLGSRRGYALSEGVGGAAAEVIVDHRAVTDGDAAVDMRPTGVGGCVDVNPARGGGGGEGREQAAGEVVLLDGARVGRAVRMVTAC